MRLYYNIKQCRTFLYIFIPSFNFTQGFDWEESSVSLVNGGSISNQANHFVNMMNERAKAYKTNQILVPWGDDFKFQRAQWQFQNMDVLISMLSISSIELTLPRAHQLPDRSLQNAHSIFYSIEVLCSSWRSAV
jgi:hypothetical protein